MCLKEPYPTFPITADTSKQSLEIPHLENFSRREFFAKCRLEGVLNIHGVLFSLFQGLSMKTYSRVYFFPVSVFGDFKKVANSAKIKPTQKKFWYTVVILVLYYIYFWKNNIPLPIRSEYIETITRNSDPNVLLKEPYFPSHLIWMHSNNHSKQWSLFSTMCLKEPHPFPSHIRIHSNNH